VPIFIGRGAPLRDFARYRAISQPRPARTSPYPHCVVDL